MAELRMLSAATYPPQHVVARGSTSPISWAQLLADIAATREQLPPDQRNWALYDTDSYRFLVGLLALLAEGHRVFLPGDNRAAVVSALTTEGVALLGEFDANASAINTSSTVHDDSLPYEDSLPGASFNLSGEIVIYTSGTSGTPKPMTKTLAQLDAELSTLEAQWGAQLENRLVVGSVSHQHFYGLLFLVLWPLCSGRSFWRRPFLDPALMVKEIQALQPGQQWSWIASPAHLHRLDPALPWPALRGQLAPVFCSGGPLQLEAAQTLTGQLGAAPIEVLGSSETGGIAWRCQNGSDSPWQPLPGIRVAQDASGALAVYSPFLAGSEPHVTADAATVLPDGRFQLGERLDRIVKIEGKRVALSQVEQQLLHSPLIADAAVFIPSGRRQRLTAAVVFTDKGISQLATDGLHRLTCTLREELLLQLPAIAVPRTLRPMAQLPRNSQGKLLSEQLPALAEPRREPPVLRCERQVHSVRLTLYLGPGSPYLEGHFPDAPVLPGVTQLLWAEHFARQQLGIKGEFRGMKAIKFQALCRPDCVLQLALDYDLDSGWLSFDFSSRTDQHSRGRLGFAESAFAESE